MNDSLQEKIKKLHLAGILQTADMRAEQAAREQMSYMEFLELLINDENLNRSRNKRNDLMNMYTYVTPLFFCFYPQLQNNIYELKRVEKQIIKKDNSKKIRELK